MTEIYVWVSSGALLALGLIWKNADVGNVMLRFAIIGIGVWGLYCSF